MAGLGRGKLYEVYYKPYLMADMLASSGGTIEDICQEQFGSSRQLAELEEAIDPLRNQRRFAAEVASSSSGNLSVGQQILELTKHRREAEAREEVGPRGRIYQAAAGGTNHGLAGQIWKETLSHLGDQPGTKGRQKRLRKTRKMEPRKKSANRPAVTSPPAAPGQRARTYSMSSSSSSATLVNHDSAGLEFSSACGRPRGRGVGRGSLPSATPSLAAIGQSLTQARGRGGRLPPEVSLSTAQAMSRAGRGVAVGPTSSAPVGLLPSGSSRSGHQQPGKLGGNGGEGGQQPLRSNNCDKISIESALRQLKLNAEE